jgi:hypothetical protein
VPAAPLFVFGVAQRTGTHYLAALLTLHPRCVPLSEPSTETASRPEDHLFDKADALLSYVDVVRRKWRADWNLGEGADHLLLSELTDALGRFVVRTGTANHTEGKNVAYVVTKTPSTANLNLLVETMPDLPVIVIARDGRSVAESAKRTFGRSYERWTRIWRHGVDNLIAASEADEGGSLKVVRYEDLLSDLEATMTDVLEHVGLSTIDYDWDAARALPVRGSSVLRGDNPDFSWAPVVDATGEVGRPRWESWPARRKARFAHLAGEQMRWLGYAVEPPAQRTAFADVIRDGLWGGARLARRAVDRVRDF